MARGSSSRTSVVNFPGAGGGGTGIITIILGIIAIVVLIYFIKKNPNFLKNLMGGGKVGAVAAGQLNPDGVTQLFAATGEYETFPESDDLGSDSVRWDLPTSTVDFEMTGYFSNAPASDTVSAKIRGGAHCEPEPCYTGCCYILQAPTTGGAGTMQTECPHQNGAGYNDVTEIETKNSAVGIGAGWRGYKVVVWNEGNGVHMRLYEDQSDCTETTQGNNWIEIFRATDTGQFPNNGADQVSMPLLTYDHTNGTSQATWRIDENTGVTANRLSLVAIQGGGEPGVTGTPGTAPPTTTPPPIDGDGNGDGDGDGDGDGTGTGVESCDETSKQCVCADGRSQTMSASQTCAVDCASLCGGSAAAARRRRSRRANLSRRRFRAYISSSRSHYVGPDTTVFTAGMARICI